MTTITIMEAKTDAHKPTANPPSWRFAFFHHLWIDLYVRACTIRALNLDVWTFRPLRAAAFTATRDKDKDRAMLLLSCCLAPLAPWQAFRVWSFYRIVIESFIVQGNQQRITYRISFKTILSYRYRTIVPKLSRRYPNTISLRPFDFVG